MKTLKTPLRLAFLATLATTSALAMQPHSSSTSTNPTFTVQDLHDAIVQGDRTAIRKCIHSRINPNVQDDTGSTPVHLAVTHEQMDALKILKHLQANFGVQNKEGLTALHIAAAHEQIEMIQCLEQAGANIEAQDKNGYTPAFTAAINGRLESIKTLGQMGANFNVKDNQGNTILHAALLHKQFDAIRVLKNFIPLSTPNSKDGRRCAHLAAQMGLLTFFELFGQADSSIHSQDNQQLKPLHLAAAQGHLEIVIKLQQLGVNLESRDYQGRTPMHYAALGGHSDVIQALEQWVVNIEARDNNGWTPIHCAAQKAPLHTLKVLEQFGVDMTVQTTQGQQTVLHLAAQNPDQAVFDYLAQNYPNLLSIMDGQAESPLHIATRLNTLQVSTLKALQDLGVDIASCNNNGQTLLHLAAQSKNAPVFDYLARYYPDLLLISDKSGVFALSTAVRSCALQVCALEALHELGVDMLLLNQKGQTLLHEAVQNPDDKVFEYLARTYQSLLHIADEQGETPLHLAARIGSARIIELCHEYQLDFTATNKRGQTPLQIATSIRGRLPQVIQAIQQAMPSHTIAQPQRNPNHTPSTAARPNAQSSIYSASPTPAAQPSKANTNHTHAYINPNPAQAHKVALHDDDTENDEDGYYWMLVPMPNNPAKSNNFHPQDEPSHFLKPEKYIYQKV